MERSWLIFVPRGVLRTGGHASTLRMKSHTHGTVVLDA